MDYCSSCRRHLNGALVCPGCGAYAPDIAPATIDSRVVPVLATGTSTGSVMVPRVPTMPAAAWEYGAADPIWYDGPRVEAPSAAAPVSGVEDADVDADVDMDADVDVDVEGVAPVAQGRAARRRQLARWKKNQRRAVVATAVALVGGGLTVLGMDRQSTDHTQAATAPDAESLGAVEEQGSQRGRTSATETDETRRTSDTPGTWSPDAGTPRDRAASDGTANSAKNGPNSPRTASSSPSKQQARTGASTPDGTVTDDAAGTPTDEATTPPATDDSGSTDTSTGSDTDTSAGSGTDSGSDTSTGTDTSDGSSSDTATTSPSGLCLLGIVCVS
ncbi:SCO2400 family protein [Streptomyces adelaidensis]|uniref:SCO2400 family protein n=1 Tax=Streptomyces adelaidensis TaxID=2796465 RepID=UPI0019087C10|nr:hypothetical protein [Streptomyces adelaidensis]